MKLAADFVLGEVGMICIVVGSVGLGCLMVLVDGYLKVRLPVGVE